jgi:hypothetical protein
MMTAQVMTKPHSLIASDPIEGSAVRWPNGDRIGHIEPLMMDKISGKVSYAVLSFGGFLGIGADLVPLPRARMTFNPTLDAYQLDVTDQALRRAPSFADSQDSTGAIVRWRKTCIVTTACRRIGEGCDNAWKLEVS